MATNSGHDSPADPPSARFSAQAQSRTQAQAALAGLDTDRAELAHRVVTPWWYHPVLGAILAVIVAAQALPLGLSLLGLLPGLLAMIVLVKSYSRRYGVAVSGSYGPRTRRLQIAVGALVGITIAAALALKLAEAPVGWTLLPMAVVLVGIILIGRRYDAALRSELAHDQEPRT